MVHLGIDCMMRMQHCFLKCFSFTTAVSHVLLLPERMPCCLVLHDTILPDNKITNCLKYQFVAGFRQGMEMEALQKTLVQHYGTITAIQQNPMSPDRHKLNTIPPSSSTPSLPYNNYLPLIVISTLFCCSTDADYNLNSKPKPKPGLTQPSPT